MKQILIAFVAATVLLALEDALARQCRNLLWSGILPLAALLSSVGLLAAGALPFSAVFPVAIYGQVARPTVPVLSAVSAIRTLSALTG